MKLMEIVIPILLLGMAMAIMSYATHLIMTKRSHPWPVVDGVYTYQIKGGKVTDVRENEDGTITITLEDVEMVLIVEED